MTEPMGNKVTVQFSEIAGPSPCEKQVYRNVTEVHWNYPTPMGERVAFESDIHGTGITWACDWIAEFEVVPEIEIADKF